MSLPKFGSQIEGKFINVVKVRIEYIRRTLFVEYKRKGDWFWRIYKTYDYYKNKQEAYLAADSMVANKGFTPSQEFFGPIIIGPNYVQFKGFGNN